MVVSGNSKQRPVLRDTILGARFWELRSTHEEVDALREGLHVVMHCYMRRHFAGRSWLHEHPGGHQ